MWEKNHKKLAFLIKNEVIKKKTFKNNSVKN